MAGEFSTVGSGYGLDIVTGRNAGPGARTTYLAMLSAAPTDASTLATMTEIGTSGYARQSIAWTAPSGDPAETHNSAVITFTFTADPANITHAAIVSASSGTTGDFLMWWALDNARDAGAGESISFPISSVSMTLD